MHRNTGFTLIEILITIAVIAIISAALLVPMLGNRRATTSNTANINCGRAIQNAQTLYSSRNGVFATNMADLSSTNIDLLDACDWSNPSTAYSITGDSTAGQSFAFTVHHQDSDTPYRVTPNAITAIHE